MQSLLHDYTTGLLDNVQPPCLSLYQPTSRHHPANQQDPIRFGNLLRDLEQELRKNYPTHDARRILRPFEELGQNHEFWNHTLDGLAIFASPDRFQVYTLPRPVQALTIVADSFHIKPLIRFLQSADRYHVLGVSRESINLFEGNRDELHEVELDPAVPLLPSDVSPGEIQGVGVPAWAPVAGVPGVQFGKGSKSDIEDHATARFFRAVDRAVLEHHSRPTRLPLILAALPENQSFFRALSHNPFLVPEEVTAHPEALTIEALRERAWAVMAPHYRTRLAGLVEMFGTARARELGDEDLERVAASAIAARVGTLLAEADRQIPGRIDPETGAVVLGGDGVDDVLDDIAELVIRHGGQVVIVPTEDMPTRTGLAAIYRF